MKTIIAGSRTLDLKHVKAAMAACPFEVTEVVCGCCKGIDRSVLSGEDKALKIENYKSIDKGKLLGAFDLTTPNGFTFFGMKVFSGANGHFVSFPERQYQSNGETKYAKVVTIADRATSDKFSGLVVDALKSQGHLN